MCGRYRLSRRKQAIEDYFATQSNDIEWSPRYNIAPTQPVLTIRQNAKEPVRELSLMRWGLIPSWAKDTSIGPPLINARAETAPTKPAFKDALKYRRCLIPADGFYEWQRASRAKQPYCFEIGEGTLFAFAGLWDQWKSAKGELLESCSILTTTPNSLTRDVHDRMPVILGKDDYDFWLDPGLRSIPALSELLRPFDGAHMRRFPVSGWVNKAENDDEKCCSPIALDLGPVQQSLLE